MSQQFLITAPDGTKYQVTGPDGATEQDALAQVQAQHAPAVTPQAKGPSALKQAAMAPIGAAELYGELGTGVLAAIPAAVAYGGAAIAKAAGADVDPSAVQSRVQNYLTYQPRSDSAKAGGAAVTNTIAPVVAPIVKGYGDATAAVAAKSPIAGELMRAAPAAFQAASSLVPGAAGVRAAMTNVARPAAANGVADIATRAFTSAPTAKSVAANAPRGLPAAGTAEEVLTRQAASSPTNMGAAASAANLASATPELKNAIVSAARKTGGTVNPEALARHIDANAVFKGRAHLTEGQALEDVHLLSEEQNLRGKIQRLGTNFDDQNKALGQYMQEMRDESGPDVFSRNHVEHGDTLIGRYKAIDDQATTAITSDYKALKDAAGGKRFPVSAPDILRNATEQLHGELLFDHAPAAVMKTLQRLADSPAGMTFENFESMRTNLARIMRSSTDGNEVAAAGVIREAMEALPLEPGAAHLKPLADKARASAKARFDALKADPAYFAAVNDKVPADQFVSKFVTGGTRDNVAKLAQAMAGDDAARQTVEVAALDFLRDQAKLNPEYKGNFASASFDKALRKLDPSLQSLVSPKTAEDLERLSRVGRYTTYQPKGSYVSNSGTVPGALAEGAKSAAEGAMNFKAGGLPVGTVLRKGLEKVTTKRRAERALAPGAGLTKLKELGKTP